MRETIIRILTQVCGEMDFEHETALIDGGIIDISPFSWPACYSTSLVGRRPLFGLPTPSPTLPS